MKTSRSSAPVALSRRGLVVMGMHRSGTSAATGLVSLCGAWAGDASDLTSPNAENPWGFWERRDVRTICDRLLHSAGADWWKTADFDVRRIPHSTLSEERQCFADVIAHLSTRAQWVIKEPRLCLLLPVLRGDLSEVVCIHLFRNPLEVARSLQLRNGFGLAGSLALWEAYNRHALAATENLPRVLISHEALMLDPYEVLEDMLGRLGDMGLTDLERPSREAISRQINPSFYRQRASAEDLDKFLSPSQLELWQQLTGEGPGNLAGRVSISEATRQHLLDLESAERSTNYYKRTASEHVKAVQRKERAVVNLRGQRERLNSELARRNGAVQFRDRKLVEQRERMQEARQHVAEEKQRVKELTEEVAVVQRERAEAVAGLQKERAEEKQRVEELTEEVAGVQRERAEAVAGLQKERAEEKQRVEELTEEVAGVQRERAEAVAGLQKERAEEKQRVEELTEEVAGVQRERAEAVAGLQKERAEEKQRVEELTEEVAGVQRERAEAVAGLQKERAEEKQRVEELTEEVAGVQRERAEAVAGLQKERAEEKQRVEELTEEVAGVQRERAEAVAGLQKERAEEKQRVEELTEEVAGVQRERAEAVAGLQKERAEEVAGLVAELSHREKVIEGLHRSFSWKVTLPLRIARRARDRAVRSMRRLKEVKKQRAASFMPKKRNNQREARSLPQTEKSRRQLERTTQLMRELAEAARVKGSLQGRKGLPAQKMGSRRRVKVSVIAWSAGHNALGRAYLIADLLRQDFDVEIIAACFPQYGSELWKPLRACSRVTIKTFSGHDFPEHFRSMENIAEQIDGDVLYVSKARLPSLELGILAKLVRNRPIILDVDDYELSFFRQREPLTLEALVAGPRGPGFLSPYQELWTRYSETLIPHFDALTVANEELQAKYGGIVLPHIRDERLFNPHLYPRERARQILGFGPDDKVVVFVGTPRLHKGVFSIAEALSNLRDGKYRLLVVGSLPNEKLEESFGRLDRTQVKGIPDVQFQDIPAYLRAGDLVCLLQEPGNVTSQFQTPAKFTDALSMALPILGSNVPPLARAAREGLLQPVKDGPLGPQIAEIFANIEMYRERARRNRDRFLSEYSYGGKRSTLKETIEAVVDKEAPVPDEFRKLITFHREQFGGVGPRERTTPQVVAGQRDSEEVPLHGGKREEPSDRHYVDDKLDIVFFWKQNDSGIYGRRQDMLVKYLGKSSCVNRILHFDAPMEAKQLAKLTVRGLTTGRYSHDRLVARQTMRRLLGWRNEGKIENRAFVYVTRRKMPNFLRRWIPSEKDYLDYLSRSMRECGVGARRTLFWVCPRNFYFPAIRERFRPELTIADVIDDHRRWPGVTAARRAALSRNYEDIVAVSDLVLVNCRSMLNAMRLYKDEVHLVANAAEFPFSDDGGEEKVAFLKHAKDPIVGYVGNLDGARMDLELLQYVARERPNWNLVFVGSMHKNDDLRLLEPFPNVHFVGVLPYNEALRCMRRFRVAVIPHADNPLTRTMSPLKVYVYLSLGLPVVSTRVANMEQFGECVRIAKCPRDFVRAIEECLGSDSGVERMDDLRDFLRCNSWDVRVQKILSLVEKKVKEADANEKKIRKSTRRGEVDGRFPKHYSGQCTVCGLHGRFEYKGGPVRESYRCGGCGASLRYREQARIVVRMFSQGGGKCLAELCEEEHFRSLKIYEPGVIGPFRNVLGGLRGYRQSAFWSEVKPGAWKDGLQCQNLTKLTYRDEEFDLVLSSDVFEHVRRPFEGFREVNRVLKVGGVHVFSIPVRNPIVKAILSRVDTWGMRDVPIVAERFHGAPHGGRSLVYTDFGEEMKEILTSYGIGLVTHAPDGEGCPDALRGELLTLHWSKESADLTERGRGKVEQVEELSATSCNICGRHRFEGGPKGRMARTGRFPGCANCGSLERHRLIRRLWNCVPLEYLRDKRILQFSNDGSVENKWFGSFEVSVYGKRNSLDLQKIERRDGAYDIVICNHVLEHVEKDIQAFREVMRVLKRSGFVQFSVPNPKVREVTEDWGYAKAERHGHYRTYGRDLMERFGNIGPGVTILEVDATDMVTGVSDFVYFASLDGGVLDAMEGWFRGFEVRRRRA